MKWLLILLIPTILLTITIIPMLVYALEQRYELEEIGRCGYIFEFLPDGNLICATRMKKSGELGAEVRLLDLKSGNLIKLADIPDVYVGEDPRERGLVGLTLDPEFKKNHYVYLHWTYKDEVDQKQYKRVARLVYDESSNRLTGMRILLDKIPASKIHNGGPLEFGPDGLLYITNGDADDSPQSRKRVLDAPYKRSLDTLEGKILRIDRDGNIPEDNPYPDSPIYTTGHRNVWGIAFHPVTGLPYVTENGPETDDEINILYKGMDYGWPLMLGYAKAVVKEDEFPKYNFEPSRYVKPIWSTGHITTAPTQLTFYTGSKYPEFVNDLLFLTLNDSSLNRIKLAPPDYTKIKEFHIYPLNIGIPTDIEVDSDGDIYISNLDNKIYRLNFTDSITSESREATTIKFEPNEPMVKVGDEVSLKATLYDSRGNPLVYMPVNFIIDDQIIATVRTKDNGTASMKYEVTSPGRHTVRVESLADPVYMKSTDSYTFVAVQDLTMDGGGRRSVYEAVFTEDGRVGKMMLRLSVFPVGNDGRLSNSSPTVFTVELLDRETLSPVDGEYEYDIIIISVDDGRVLLTEKGSKGSNIHLHTFDSEGERITLKVVYNGQEARVSFTVVPEFMYGHLLIVALSISALILIIRVRAISSNL